MTLGQSLVAIWVVDIVFLVSFKRHNKSIVGVEEVAKNPNLSSIHIFESYHINVMSEAAGRLWL